MKTLLIAVSLGLGILLSVVYVDTGPYSVESTVVKIEQPQREPYIAPQWVVNERGQRCIKQGEVITCG